MTPAVILFVALAVLAAMIALVRGLIRAAAAGPCHHGNGPGCYECWVEQQW